MLPVPASSHKTAEALGPDNSQKILQGTWTEQLKFCQRGGSDPHLTRQYTPAVQSALLFTICNGVLQNFISQGQRTIKSEP